MTAADPATEFLIIRKATVRREQLRIVGDRRCNDEPILRIAMVLGQLNGEPSDERRDGKQTHSRPIERGVEPRIQGNGDFNPASIDEPCHLETRDCRNRDLIRIRDRVSPTLLQGSVVECEPPDPNVCVEDDHFSAQTPSGALSKISP